MELSLQEYAAYGVIVTTEHEVGGLPTVPLSHALGVADHLAEFETNNDEDWS